MGHPIIDAESYKKRDNGDDMNPIGTNPKRLPCSKNKVLVRLLTFDDMPLHLAEYQRKGPRSAVLAELHIHLHQEHEHVVQCIENMSKANMFVVDLSVLLSMLEHLQFSKN